MHGHLASVAGLAPDEVDISRVGEVDTLWSSAEESGKSAFGRADKALAFLMARPERTSTVLQIVPLDCARGLFFCVWGGCMVCL